MYEIDREALENRITNAKFSKNDETNKALIDSMLALMKELCDYTQKVNETLVNNAYAISECYRIDDLYTAVLMTGDDAEYEAAGLYKMGEDIPYRVFLNCEYDEIRDIVGDLSQKKIYKGSYIKDGNIIKFDYWFEFDNSFVKAQERMFSYAEQFCVKNPIIFSPYSHKSFIVKFNDSIKNENVKLDFCFADNNIPVIDGNNCLYWNIHQSIEADKTYDAKEPYGDNTKYIYFFKKTKKGNYLLPLPVNNQTNVYDIRFTENGVEAVIDHDIEDFVIFEYNELDLNSKVVRERRSKQMLFVNRVEEKTQNRRRILSEGDIERAIGCFREWQDICCGRSSGEGSRVIRYSKKYSANRKDKTMFNTIRREYVYFKKKDSSRRFLTDHANYILEYLEYYYPEIEWAGEI